jgi:mRNA-degrading endonuclease RelE of RelBE toxin-antitoxin system/predicted transcriptional regulator
MSSLEAVILSLSEELIAELDRARMGRNRSRSEIVAEALCWYFQSTTVETPTDEEVAAIEGGRAAIERATTRASSSSSMTSTLIVAKPAQKQLERVPRADLTRLVQALHGMRRNPFEGDAARLKNKPANFRRRVGAWRILFRP